MGTSTDWRRSIRPVRRCGLVAEPPAADRPGVTYADQPRADLLLAGVPGNITVDDVPATVRALPSLCAPEATVIWTRIRQPPDLTSIIRTWFAEAGFVERAFDAPDDVLFSVGVHHFAGDPQPRPASGQLFRFVR